MLHNEVRELLVEGYEATQDAEGIAKAYSVSKWTVYRLAEQKRKTGSVKLRTSQRGRKPALTTEGKANIRDCINADPDITIEEIREELHLSASYSTVERAIDAMGYNHSTQASVTVFDVKEKRREWKETIKPEMAEHLVFLDESGVNTDLTRLYGRAPSSQRAVDHAPLNTPQTTTVLSSIRLNGEKAFITYQGGTTGERFVQYLKETLLPTLRPGDIVVMDNIRSHHVILISNKTISFYWKWKRTNAFPFCAETAQNTSHKNSTRLRRYKKLFKLFIEF